MKKHLLKICYKTNNISNVFAKAMFSLIAELKKMQRFRSILRWTGSGSIQSWTGSGSFPSWTGSVSFLRWTGSGSFPSWTRSGSFLRWTGSGSDLGHQDQDLTLLVKWYLYNVLFIFFSGYFETFLISASLFAFMLIL